MDGGELTPTATGSRFDKLHSISAHLEEVHDHEGHSRAVYSIAFSKDGQFALTGSADKTAKLWSYHTGHVLHTFHGHEQWVQGVAFANNSMMVATGSDDNYVRIFVHDHNADSIAEGWTMSAELGRQDDEVHAHTLSALTVAFDPMDDYVSSGSADQSVKLWRLADKECAHDMLGHTDWVSKVAYSPDGMILASSSYDETVKLWRVSDGDELLTCSGHGNFVSCVAWSPDGNKIVTSSGDYSIRIWVVRTTPVDGGPKEVVMEAKPERVMYGHRGWVLSCTYSPYQDRIASTSADKTIILWDPVTFQAVERIFLPDWVEDCVYVPSRKLNTELVAVGHFVDAITFDVTSDYAEKRGKLSRNKTYSFATLRWMWYRLNKAIFGPPRPLPAEDVAHIEEFWTKLNPDPDEETVLITDFLQAASDDKVMQNVLNRHVFDEVMSNHPYPRTVLQAIEQHREAGVPPVYISLEELMVALEGLKNWQVDHLESTTVQERLATSRNDKNRATKSRSISPPNKKESSEYSLGSGSGSMRSPRDGSERSRNGSERTRKKSPRKESATQEATQEATQ